MEARTTKAVGLLSGGLDSTLAAKLMMEQGIEVHAINFTSPFCTCTAKGASCAAVFTAVKQLGDIPLQRVVLGDDYLGMVKNPKHGYGRAMNPCIDCRIMKLRKAGEYMREIGASFLFTGEVLGQRPMSQHFRALELIDRDSGLGELTVRPLSASHLPETLPERTGLIDRAKLLALSGRTRKPQIALAAEKGIAEYPCPAGGCRLTDRHFGERLRDYLDRTHQPTIRDIPILKVGRHFRSPSGDMIVVARNEHEGAALKNLLRPSDHLLEPGPGAPIVLIRGSDLSSAAGLMVRFASRGLDDERVIQHSYEGKSVSVNLGELEPDGAVANWHAL